MISAGIAAVSLLGAGGGAACLAAVGAAAGAGSAASSTLDSLIQQYAHIEGTAEEPDELQNVTENAFRSAIASRRQLLEETRRVDARALPEAASVRHCSASHERPQPMPAGSLPKLRGSR